MGKSEPTRSCAGCRERDARDALLRFVLSGDPPAVVPDVRRRGSGRGVSVHPRRRCLHAAVRAGAFRRAFRRDLSPDVDELARWAGGQYARRMDGLLTAAYRAGKAVVGTERVREAIERRQARLLLIAQDAGDNRQEMKRMAERLGGNCIVHAHKNHLGSLFGRGEIAVVAITDPNIAEELQTAARCALDLAEAS